MFRPSSAFRIGTGIIIAAVFFGPWTYVFFWRSAAEREAVRVAELIAKAQPLEGEVVGPCAMLEGKLSSGFNLEGSDGIPFGLRDYEVFIRSATGDLLSFDVYRREGAWRVVCPGS